MPQIYDLRRRIEQLQRNVLTYTTTHKEQLKTRTFDTQSPSGVEERQKIIKEEGSKEAEAWDLIADHTAIERVYLFAIKRLLNISAKTPSALVYGEVVYIKTYTNIMHSVLSHINWLSVTRMIEDRIKS